MEQMERGRIGHRVYLAYFDESESYDKNIVVVAGVLATDPAIKKMENIFFGLREFLVPEGQKDKFTEFHTSDLFSRRGIFENIDGLDQAASFRALEKEGQWIGRSPLGIFYAAIDCQAHSTTIYGNASPLSTAFRSCLEMIEARLSEHKSEELTIAVFDDPGKKDVRLDLLLAFRDMRPKLESFSGNRGPLVHFHDDLYFGDSAFSVGLQVADFCAFFIRRHEEKKANTEHIYDSIRERILHSKQLP
jgi:hypothetical protein